MIAMDTEYLSADPIPSPAIRATPEGGRLDFDEVVRQSGMRNVVSTYDPPEIRLHRGPRDFKAVSPGRVVYCIAEVNLPQKPQDRAREVLRRLAYGFHDWAAREIVARFHRDIKRHLLEATARQPRLEPSSIKIKRFLQRNPGATVGEIADATGVAQPNVSRTIAVWHDDGRVRTQRDGRFVKCYFEEVELPQKPEDVSSDTGSSLGFPRP